MLTLIAWLNLHTEYSTQVELPNIVISERGHMCQSFGIKDLSQCKNTQLMGFYNESHTIYLHANFNPNDAVDQSRLLHELVHYLQWKNSHQETCRGLLEVEAYNLQDEWLMQHDLEQRADAFKLVMLEASCET